jgi:hypothetical protein
MLTDEELKPDATGYKNSIFFPQSHTNLSNYTKLQFQPIEHLPSIKSLPYTAQKLSCVALLISLLVGTYFKLILYRYFWRCRGDKSKNFKNRPINSMILVGAIIHHLTHLYMGINYCLALGFDVHLGVYMGEFYCNLTLFVGVFGMAYLITGSMVMAIFRVLYMKHGTWLRAHTDNGVIASLALAGGILLSLVLSILFIIERSSKRVTYNTCMGYSTDQMDIMYQYQGHRLQSFTSI